MNRFLFFSVGLFVLGVAGAAAQPVDVYLTGIREPAQVIFGVQYQQYDAATDTALVGAVEVSEISLPISAFIPLRRDLALNLILTPAMASGPAIESLGGLSDAQAVLNYYRRVGRNSLVGSLGVNLPSGQRALTPEEFATSALLSQSVYDFQVPVFGQGFNVSPGLTLAVPVGANVVLGIGGVFQYRGAYEPLADMEDSFDPGDEILMTAGVDLRLDAAWSVATDVTYTLFGTDRLGEVEVFDSGDQIVVTGQLRGGWTSQEVRLVGRYRNRAISTVPTQLGAENLPRTLPNLALARLEYRQALTETMSVGASVQFRSFGETDFSPALALVDLGLAPALLLSSSISAFPTVAFTLGDLTGLQLGLSLAFQI